VAAKISADWSRWLLAAFFALWTANYSANAYVAVSGRAWDPARLDVKVVSGRGAQNQCFSYKCMLVIDTPDGGRLSFACQPYKGMQTCFNGVRGAQDFYSEPLEIEYFTTPSPVYPSKNTAVEIRAKSRVFLAGEEQRKRLRREAREEDRRRRRDTTWYGAMALVGLCCLLALIRPKHRRTPPASRTGFEIDSGVRPPHAPPP